MRKPLILAFAFAVLGISMICLAYLDGKHTADRWYAQHWHPLVDRNEIQAMFPEFSADVTVIGHHITVVNGSHVIVIQCSDETAGSAVMLNNGQAMVCSGGVGNFNWNLAHPRRIERLR